MGNTKAIITKNFTGSNNSNVTATATWLGANTRRLEISARWPRTIDAVRELYHLDRWVVPDLETQVSDAREIAVEAEATADGVDRRLYSTIEEMTRLRHSHESYGAQFREMREQLQQSGVVQRVAPPVKRRRPEARARNRAERRVGVGNGAEVFLGGDLDDAGDTRRVSTDEFLDKNGDNPVDVCTAFFNANSANGSISLQERNALRSFAERIRERG
ncbi:hypothetical protein ATCC90586_006364 [Pythium insidiosum]|nr:hypothetical protein ATCC90586_006364 [Pythium insidiosum]